MEIPSKKPEHVEYSSSVEGIDSFAEGDMEDGEENLAEELRPSEETIRIGENLLTKEIKERIVKFYAKVFDEKLTKEEKEGVPARASARAKALCVKKFFKENPRERNRIESFPDEVKEEYYRIIDFSEIKGGLGDDDMGLETPFLLYDYLRGKYNEINRELSRVTNEERRAEKEAEKESIFNALKDLTSKLSEKNIEESTLRRMGENREDYIEDRLLRPDNIETAKQKIRREAMEREWSSLVETERNNYVNFDDFCNRRVEEVRGKLGSLGSGLSEENVYSILRRHRLEDINVDRGFFGSVKGVRLGSRKILAKDFNDFISRETTIFNGTAKEKAGEMLGAGWDEKEREEQEKIIRKAFKRMTPEDIRNTCNKIREEKMKKFWKGVAGELNRKESMEEHEEEDGVDVPDFMNSFFYKKYTGNLEKDADKMLSVLKNKGVIDNDFLDVEDFLEIMKRENPKVFREREYSKRYKNKKWMQSLAFSVLETAIKERASFNETIEVITEIADTLDVDEKETIMELLNFYENEKRHKWYRSIKAIWSLEELRKSDKIEGNIISDKKHFFNIFKKETIIEKGGALSKESNFNDFLGEMVLTGIIDENYKDVLKDEKSFLLFSVDLMGLIEKKQS